jgi:hypothetical protein
LPTVDWVSAVARRASIEGRGVMLVKPDVGGGVQSRACIVRWPRLVGTAASCEERTEPCA